MLIGSFVAQDNLARTASMRLSTGTGRNLLHFTTGFQEGRDLALEFIAIANRKFFFTFAGHDVGNLEFRRKKPVIIH